ncbi:MAG TPA: UDP-glucose/GDP-mannose dehydrogenase family protein [Planctomycetaceae bacterium]|nr:UDP-glucose/GDP-mannose dehydrogenase family protein [Planctomycetaceae bacterium]HIQ21541.1 UDP-glucose/GDP-mannose dehydrogenase family protein [Planctomycetota bacterium]
MEISVIGTGYVGLVTGTCLAETGNRVTCVDCDRSKVEMLCRGEVPIYEPGLAELVARVRRAGRLRFTTDLAVAAGGAEVIFLAVGTPSAEDGSVDLSALWQAVAQMGPHLAPDALVVLKSTVPVGTNAAVTAELAERAGRPCRVASNPEFLKEGTAIDDFMKPDRVVVGAREEETFVQLRHLYEPYLRTDKPFLAMSPESAEMTKYVANALLATKISFINEMANLCERTGADINEVRRGIGHDSRIGFAFLFPGVGFGGSCFPKDVRALASLGHTCGVEPRVLEAVHGVNQRQKEVLAEKICRHFADGLESKTIAIWGLAFKPGTDDIREAPSLVLIDRLLTLGAHLRVHDPVAMENVRRLYGDRLTYCALRDEALDGAHGLAIVTEWKEFLHPDLEAMKKRMRAPVIFDGRNLYDPRRLQQAGFTYYSIGRRAVRPASSYKVVA